MFEAEYILIVEDEPLVALDLFDTVSVHGGLPLGPYASVREALECLNLHKIGGAILDATLVDRDITPVAIRLVEDGIPLVIHSATRLPAELAALHPDLPTVPKPAMSIKVAERLASEMRRLR